MNERMETGRTDVIERLQKEKAENARAWEEAGEKEGRSWASGAGYPVLKDAADTARLLLGTAGMLWDSAELHADMADLVRDCEGGGRGDGFDYGAFAEGWNRGVLAFWDEVEGAL